MNLISLLPFHNIFANFLYLQQDFVGISFNFPGVIYVVVNFLFSLLLISVFYLLGIKIKNTLLKRTNEGREHFINVALGFIVFTSGVAILGMASLLYNSVLFFYLFICFFFAFYPLRVSFNYLKRVVNFLWKEIKIQFRQNPGITIATILFISIAFLRLIPPEIGEDAIGYHTSLPYLYLQEHSIMKNPHYALDIVFPVPQLGEMVYVVTQALVLKDTSRYIHFLFYIIVVLLLYHEGKKSKSSSFYGTLLFVTAPVVIQVSTRANMDFPWLLCWILAISLITEKTHTSNTVLSGIFFGAVLATKLWTIVFFPLFVLYFFLIEKKRKATRLSVIFIGSAFLISAFWYVRAYLVVGNPLYPAFSGETSASGLFDYLGFNSLLFHYQNIIAFSPLFYIGIIIFFLGRIGVKEKTKKLFLFLVLLSSMYLFVKYHFPRYVLGLYVIAVIYISYGIESFFRKNTLFKYTFSLFYFVLFTYYFLNTLFILSYGFGWADKNKYLTRILSRDNSSYYNFDKLFDKWIMHDDLVATYGIYGYYYADFNFMDVSKVFYGSNNSWNAFREKHITKLLIKGGDVHWFCKQVGIKTCAQNNAVLLATYPADTKKYNLYSIKYVTSR